MKNTSESITLMLISRQQLPLGQGHHLHHGGQEEQYVLQGQHRSHILQPGEAFQDVNWSVCLLYHAISITKDSR